MNPARLLSHFDRISEAPDAIPRLRRFILDLAMRGKLVEQDPRDEPASDLLKRIQDAKARLVMSDEIRKGSVLPQIDVQPYEIPNGWEWSRLGNTGRIFNGNSVSESEKNDLSKVTDGYPFIATKDVGYGRDMLAYENGIKVPFDASGFKVAHSQAVLICSEGGSAGKKVGLTDQDVCFGNKLYANEVWPGIQPRYILSVYQSTAFFKEFAARMTGIIGGISRSEFLLLPVPIPPESEQHRIVDKVDELMVLCDRLEVAQAERESRRDRLAASSLNRLNNGTDADVFRNHARFYFNQFPPLTTRPEHIQRLRQTIFNLAVRGKVVPQDPTAEPASYLAERIAADKRSSPKHKGIRTPNEFQPVTPNEVIFSIPKSWHWIRVGAVSHRIIDGNYAERYPKPSEFLPQGIPFLTSAAVGPNGEILIDEVKYISPQKHGILVKAQCKVGDILLTNRGARVGAAALLTDPRYTDCNIGPQLTSIRINPSFVDRRYLLICIRSPNFQSSFKDTNAGTAMNFVNLTKTSNIPLPLPPLAEQHRIVAKIDELMALCDRLEAQLTTTQTESRRFLEATLHYALSA